MQHLPGNYNTYTNHNSNNRTKVTFDEPVPGGWVILGFTSYIHYMIGKVNEPGSQRKRDVPAEWQADMKQ